MLQDRKIPRWKEKEELFKKGSFDEALESLGASEQFFTKKKDKEKKEQKRVPCEEL